MKVSFLLLFPLFALLLLFLCFYLLDIFSALRRKLIETCFSICSSGTSDGEPKLMPSIAEVLDRRTFLYNLIMPIMNQLRYNFSLFFFSILFSFNFINLSVTVCEFFLHAFCSCVGVDSSLIPSRKGFFNPLFFLEAASICY